MCKGKGFGRAAVEVTLTQPSSFPSEKNDLLFQDPRQDFDISDIKYLPHCQVTEKIAGTNFPNENPPSRVGQLSCVITWQPETDLTLRSPSPLSTCCAVGSLSVVIISSIFLIRLLLHPLLGTPTSWCTHPPLPAFFFITDDILPVKMDQIVMQWVHFIFISRIAVQNICT